jgi:hypothetical protein
LLEKTNPLLGQKDRETECDCGIYRGYALWSQFNGDYRPISELIVAGLTAVITNSAQTDFPW